MSDCGLFSVNHFFYLGNVTTTPIFPMRKHSLPGTPTKLMPYICTKMHNWRSQPIQLYNSV